MTQRNLIMTRYEDERADFIQLRTYLGFVRAEVRKHGWMPVRNDGALCCSDVDWSMYQTWLSYTYARDAVAGSTAWQAYDSWRAHGVRPGVRLTPQREAADQPYRPTPEDMELAVEDLQLVKRKLSRNPPEEWDAELSAHIKRGVAFVAKWGANITEVADIFLVARDLRIAAAIAAGVTPTIAALGYQAGKCDNCRAVFPSEVFERSRLVRLPRWDGSALFAKCPKCGGFRYSSTIPPDGRDDRESQSDPFYAP